MINQLTDSAPVTDEDLEHMILGLERDGIYPKLLSLMRELRERRKASGDPAYYVLSDDDGIEINTVDEFSCGRRGGQPLYTAPPAQVVPNEMAISDDMNLYQKSFAQGHNACRAAMLQESQKAAGVPQNCRSCAKVQVLPPGMQTAPTLDSSPKNAESPSGIIETKAVK
ncbi:hypothetical protein [Klebsiella sp. WP8-S18-ESBL-06]|uniref:hypothetical protein n=1 Tax=Klebsiella sp. WP8-S18-ESBL-06 TaxID=2675726 RepID=UPI0015DCFCA2|nr:hypothetical protein [Klebsiella sp. WP8-S18-ESBL-06]BBT71121.1 hypothetical protein WP8S18E06_24200 [Klebsiella sp. WP8-S18-ESBL-06]